MMPLCLGLLARAVLRGAQVPVEEVYLRRVIVSHSLSPTATVKPSCRQKKQTVGSSNVLSLCFNHISFVMDHRKCCRGFEGLRLVGVKRLMYWMWKPRWSDAVEAVRPRTRDRRNAGKALVDFNCNLPHSYFRHAGSDVLQTLLFYTRVVGIIFHFI